MSESWSGGGGAMWLDALLYDTASGGALAIDADPVVWAGPEPPRPAHWRAAVHGGDG